MTRIIIMIVMFYGMRDGMTTCSKDFSRTMNSLIEITNPIHDSIIIILIAR